MLFMPCQGRGVRPLHRSQGRPLVGAAPLPVASVSAMDAIVAKSISQQRFYMLVLTMFACLSRVLDAIGIFGVLCYAVSQRTREIGIRMALGAEGRTVVYLIVRQAMV